MNRRRFLYTAACSGSAVLLALAARGVIDAIGESDSDVIDGEAKALRARTGFPIPLQVHPVRGYALSAASRRYLLARVVAVCAAKGIAYPAITVHVMRLARVAAQTKGLTDLEALDEAFRVLTDDRAFQRHGTAQPLLVDTAYGAAYRTHPRIRNPTVAQEFIGGIPHVDTVLSVFGELGYALETKLVSGSGRTYTLADVLEDSLQRFSMSRELEWSLIAYSAYLTGQNSWCNCRGERVAVDDIVAELLRRGAHVGACHGIHRVYALVRAYTRQLLTGGFISTRIMTILKAYLADLWQEVSRLQSADGWWDETWHGHASTRVSKDASAVLANRLTVTGHLLEAFAIAPTLTKPSDDVIVAGALYLERMLTGHLDRLLGATLLAATHAIRALCHLSEQ